MSRPNLAKETFSQPPVEKFYTNQVKRAKRYLGKLLSDLVQYHDGYKELDEVARVIEARSPENKLTDEQLAELMSHQDSTFDLEIRKKYFRESDHSVTLHGIVMPYLKKLFEEDPSIKSLLNIGCNYAYMDSLLAKEYKKIQFIGIDVNAQLEELNHDLKAENHQFHGGYALDMLESEQVTCDACYMSSTSTVIRNQELKRYLKVLSKSTKYVIFSEPVWTLPGDDIVDPESISVDNSLPAYVQRRPITNEYGYLCYIHNYKGLLDEAGFDPIRYVFYKPAFTYLYWVVAVGQNRQSQLWQ